MSFIATGGRVRGIRVKGWRVTAERVSAQQACLLLPARAARHWRRPLAIGVALVLAGCTLTEDSFEPRRIKAEQTQSEGLAPEPPSPSTAAAENGTPNTPTATTPAEQELPAEVELAPGSAPGERAERGEGQLGAAASAEEEANAPADAGAAPSPPSEPGDNPRQSNPPDNDLQPDAGAPPAAEPCPGSTFGGSCYEFFAGLAAWPAAEQACVGWGGHLASVSSAAEDTFLASWPQALGVPSGNGAGLWLGASDTAQDGVFQWTDASPFAFPGWGAAQPDNGPSVADCVEKRNDGAAAWHDRHCTDQLVYVCEKPL